MRHARGAASRPNGRAQRVRDVEKGIGVAAVQISAERDARAPLVDIGGREPELLLNLAAIVFTLLKSKVVGAFFSEIQSVLAGNKVYPLNEPATISCDYSILGKLVDCFGSSFFVQKNKSNSQNVTKSKIEVKGPGIVSRFKVNDSLITGIKVLDALVPIGKGQRELIIGDRQTGKTSLIIDTILNQKFELQTSFRPVICVYVGIGQKKSSLYRIFDFLESAGAMFYTTIIAASVSDSVAAQYLAPFSGTAVCEFFQQKGFDTLIGYDDLSKHAVAYRQLSLLLRRAPGREAYPGDVFYLHSRLLERSANLLFSGSITALPVIETLSGDVSAYIPTNVISITDGQIFLDTNLFYQGIIPAINVGLSVSRIGAAAQPKMLKNVAGSLKLELALFREIEGFASFSSNLDEQTSFLLKKGQMLVELLKQDRFECFSILQQSLSILLMLSNEVMVEIIDTDSVKDFVSFCLTTLNYYHFSKVNDEK
jgi:proton translocating ATP synthase F1 alpha subunit